MKQYVFLALLGLGLAGCSSSTPKEAVSSPAQAAAEQVVVSQTPTIQAPDARTTSEATSPAESFGAPALPVARSTVYRGELRMTVTNFEQASASIDQLLAAHHAYLDTAHETRANGEHQQDLTIKVWPAEFTTLVAALGKLGRIDHKDIASADVTADLLDGGSALQTKQASLTQLRALLAKTTEAPQRHRLEEQLRQTQQAAEDTQAHLRATAAESRWAVLKLHFTQVLPAEEPASPLPAFRPRWQAAFYNGWSVLFEVVVVLTNLWPLLLLGGGVAGALRYWKHRPAA